MIILATYNIKGGVGKTATAVNLSYLAAAQGLTTLLWDLDPQGAATFYLRIHPRVSGGIDRLLAHKHALDAAIKASDFEHLDVLPADFSYRHFDLALYERNKPAKQLRKLLEPIAEDYALIILDCPPGISLLADNVFKAADALIVPTIPTPLSLRTHRQLLDHLQGLHKRIPDVLPFFVMVDHRKRLHRDIVKGATGTASQFLSTTIPYASQVELMGQQRAPLLVFAPASSAAQAYANLWAEIRQRMGIV